MVLLLVMLLCQSGDADVQSPQQPSATPQSSDVSDDALMQSAELKRTEMKLLRQIESIQEERSLFTVDEIYFLSSVFCCALYCLDFVEFWSTNNWNNVVFNTSNHTTLIWHQGWSLSYNAVENLISLPQFYCAGSHKMFGLWHHSCLWLLWLVFLCASRTDYSQCSVQSKISVRWSYVWLYFIIAWPSVVVCWIAVGDLWWATNNDSWRCLRSASQWDLISWLCLSLILQQSIIALSLSLHLICKVTCPPMSSPIHFSVYNECLKCFCLTSFFRNA